MGSRLREAQTGYHIQDQSAETALGSLERASDMLHGIPTIRFRPAHLTGIIPNPHGGEPVKARYGAPGIAWVRHDLITGKITLEDLLNMSSSAVGRKYRVSQPRASKILKHIRQFGVDGAKRRLDGSIKGDE